MYNFDPKINILRQKITTTMAPKRGQKGSKSTANKRSKSTASALEATPVPTTAPTPVAVVVAATPPPIASTAAAALLVAPLHATTTPASSKVAFSCRSGIVRPQELKTVPGEVNLEDGGDTPSIDITSNNCADWYESCRQTGRKGSDSMLTVDLSRYVRNDLFSKLKFFMSQKQLKYNFNENSICQQIIKDMSLKGNRGAAWWEIFKNKISSTLNNKRADVTAAIKRSFMRKYSTGTRLFPS
jgi:hypothetical protein